MTALHIGPINAATPTPLLADGSLDKVSAKKLCRRWVDIGLNGVLILGSMGEGYDLTDATRDAWIETALAETAGKLVVFVSVADLSRARMIERAKRYAAMGAPCIVICLPPKVPAARAIADVKAVADACPVPCAYYDIPANTGTPLELEEVLQIVSHRNFVAMKDSSGNATLAQGLMSKQYRPANVKLLHGNEYHVAWSALIGYDGVLHGGGVLSAKWVRAIWDHVAAGRVREAVALDHEKSLCLARIYNRFSKPLQNAVGQKYALQLLGCLDGHAVVNGQSLSDADRVRVRAAVDEYRAWLA